MGTRRSRHNRGRKPLYKDHRSVAANLIANPWGGRNLQWPLMQNITWSDAEKFKLDILCEADANVEQSAAVFARGEKAIAWKARELGLVLPIEWSRLIAPKYKPRLRVQRAPILAYPYITKVRDEHADILAINAMIPKSIPDNMRADMCQEIMLAILEGRTTLEMLKARDRSPSYFIKKFYHDNYEAGGHSISFDEVKEDWDSDAVASSIAAKEWRAERGAELATQVNSMRTFTPATQFEAAFRDQISRAQMGLHELGQFLSEDEVEELLNAPL